MVYDMYAEHRGVGDVEERNEWWSRLIMMWDASRRKCGSYFQPTCMNSHVINAPDAFNGRVQDASRCAPRSANSAYRKHMLSSLQITMEFIMGILEVYALRSL